MNRVQIIIRLGVETMKKLLSTLLLVSLLLPSIIVAAEEPVTLTYAYWGQPSEIAAQEAIIKAFEAQNDHIRIESEHVSSTPEFNAAIMTRIAAGNAPDIFYIGEVLVEGHKKLGTLLDLLPYAKQSGFNLESFWPSLLSPMGYNDGHLYAIPKDCTAMMIYYNKSMLDAAGIPYPSPDWTWEDYVKMVNALTIKDENGRIIQYGSAGDAGWPTWLGFVYKNGGQIIDPKSGRMIPDDPKTIEALQRYIDLGLVDGAMPTPDQLASLGNSTSQDLFMSGMAATMIAGRWQTFFFKDFEGEYGYINFPNTENGNGTGTLFVTLAAPITTKHPKEVWEFLEFYCGELGTTLNTNMGLGMPVTEALTEKGVWMLEGEGEKEKQLWITELKNSKPLPFHAEWAMIIDEIFNRHMTDAARGTITVEEAMRLSAEEANAYLDQKENTTN